MDGEFERGHRTMLAGLETFVATGAGVQRTPWFGMLAEVHLHAGQIEEGLNMVETALSWSGQNERAVLPFRALSTERRPAPS